MMNDTKKIKHVNDNIIDIIQRHVDKIAEKEYRKDYYPVKFTVSILQEWEDESDHKDKGTNSKNYPNH